MYNKSRRNPLSIMVETAYHPLRRQRHITRNFLKFKKIMGTNGKPRMVSVRLLGDHLTNHQRVLKNRKK